MNSSTVIAVCAVVIAVASLGVSVYEARATRMHNRRSVQPILSLWGMISTGATSGGRAQQLRAWPREDYR